MDILARGFAGVGPAILNRERAEGDAGRLGN
jgi:hypothetical protein